MLHLVHPATVHFTVAFLVVGGLVEAYGILRDREAPERFGGTLVLLGTACLVASVVTGILAENSITYPPGAGADIDTHERLGLIVLAVFLVALFWKGWDRGRVRASVRPLFALFLLGGVAAVVLTAWLGGDLVYVHGVGVGVGG